MVNPAWDSASVDEKLELLRNDIGAAAEAHNLFRSDFRVLSEQVQKLVSELKEIRQKTLGG